MTREVTQLRAQSASRLSKQSEFTIEVVGTQTCAQTFLTNVSWLDIQAFVKKMNQANGLTCRGTPRDPRGCYRLPTEAEWEYVARAGTSTRYSFGEGNEDILLGYYAWYEDNSNSTPHPVGSKRPNPWGFYDMYGNVWSGQLHQQFSWGD